MDEPSDPAGASSNPGGSRRIVLRAFLERLRGRVEADPEGGRLLMERVLGGPIFAALRREPRGSLPVGFLGEMTRRALGAATRLVEMPEHIVHKQQGRWKRAEDHSDLTPDDYRLLPRLISEPQIVLRYQPESPRLPEEVTRRLNLISEVDGTFYNVVVGRDRRDPRRVVLVSFYRIDDGRSQVEHMIRKAETSVAGQRVFLNLLPSGK